MPQITVYLKKQLEQAVRRHAKASHETLSSWVSRALEKQISNEWPEEVLDLAGAWQEFPEAEELRNGLGSDVPREKL